MRVKLPLVICHGDGHEETVTDVIPLKKNHQRSEHLGLTLAESTHLLSTLQRHLLQKHVDTFLDTHATCPDCGVPLKRKARGSHSFRTLFGTFQVWLLLDSRVLCSHTHLQRSTHCYVREKG